MSYADEKERLLAVIEEKYGIAMRVCDDSDEHNVLRALGEIAGEEKGVVPPSEGELLRFLEGKETPSSVEHIIKQLEKVFANKPVALFGIVLSTPSDDVVRRILIELCGDDAILISKNSRELYLLMPVIDDDPENDLMPIATAIADTLAAEAMTMAVIIIDSIINKMDALPRSYVNLEKAKIVGLRLNPEERVISFHHLGLGKVLHVLSEEEREEFLMDNLGSFRFSRLDPEMQTTIRTFFDADLSVTETAKRLFIHRNTLIYRIDKLYKLTGLDLRRFGDAVIAKIALQIEELGR